MSERAPTMTKDEMRIGLQQGRRLIQEEWAIRFFMLNDHDA